MKSHLLVVLIIANLFVTSFGEDDLIESNLPSNSKEETEDVKINEEVKEEKRNEDNNQQEDEKNKASILFEMAMEILNNSKTDKTKAYYILQEAARLNNSKAQEMAAQAYLFGDNLPLNIPLAIYYFEKAAEQGSPTAQLVKCLLLLLFYLLLPLSYNFYY